MTQSAILELIKSFAEEKYPDSEVFLFGSTARQAQRTDSDLDILLLLDEDSIDAYQEKSIMDDFYDLELKTGVVISPLIYSKKVWNKTRQATTLFQVIQKEAIRLK